jgi:hypothetical protein
VGRDVVIVILLVEYVYGVKIEPQH